MAERTRRLVARTGAVFAATMLTLAGVMQAVVGIAAIAGRDFFTAPRHYLFTFSVTGWGWAHLVIGALLVATAFGLFAGAVWAAYAGMVLAALAALDNFFFLPYYPVWALVLIALDGFVLWSLATVLRDRVLTGEDAAEAARRWPSGGRTDRPSRHVSADAPMTPTGTPVRTEPPGDLSR
ncbi:DUF7144 family membrane protein [Actinocatenispora rupis]|uniref:DUF7144 domain-containing protein n=1 Tax=Actinocatenispora rupis TaxID=519421 RepID=A0A8J3JC47_9ACTN|nr:hypothetical protein [Actinocatenispora rupis]GID15722.1 hypothetical protein Aru02nite_66110 [Actinocatenispora rupis]